MKRILYWLTVNALFAACLYLAIMHKMQWAENIAIFVSLIALLISFCAHRASEKYGYIFPVPIWLGIIYELLIIYCLAEVRWFWVIPIYILQEYFLDEC